MTSLAATSTDHATTVADRTVGTIGLACAVGVAVILGVHPFGTTELYDDGPAFLEHVGWFWVIIHFAATPLLFGFALVIRRWETSLAVPAANVFAQWAGMVALAGMAIGALHLIGTDTVTFFAFSDTYEAAGGSEAALVGADLLLRIHAATLTSWIIVFWFMTPLLVTTAMVLQGDRPLWLVAIGGLSALCQVVAVVLFLNAGQYTTVAETGFFRVGVTLLVALIAILSWDLRRSPDGSPALRS